MAYVSFQCQSLQTGWWSAESSHYLEHMTSLLAQGGLAVAVPGELAGMKLIHEQVWEMQCITYSGTRVTYRLCMNTCLFIIRPLHARVSVQCECVKVIADVIL